MTDIDWTQLEADRAIGWVIRPAINLMDRNVVVHCGAVMGVAQTVNRRIARLDALEAYALRARRIEAAADELARVMNDPNQSDGSAGRYHYDWHRVDAALAALAAAKGGDA